MEITKENPIQMDVMFHSGDQQYVNQFNAYKKNLEENLDGLVQVNLMGFSDRADYNSSSYFPTRTTTMTCPSPPAGPPTTPIPATSWRPWCPPPTAPAT